MCDPQWYLREHCTRSSIRETPGPGAARSLNVPRWQGTKVRDKQGAGGEELEERQLTGSHRNGVLMPVAFLPIAQACPPGEGLPMRIDLDGHTSVLCPPQQKMPEKSRFQTLKERLSVCEEVWT